MKLPVKVGDLVKLAEADYCYGVGELVLKITRLPADELPDGSDWVYVRGIEVGWNGEERGERVVLVRTSALRPARS